MDKTRYDRRQRKAPAEKQRRTVRRRGAFLRAVDLPEALERRLPLVRLCGDARMEVENCSGVLELGGERIRLYTGLGILRIEGKNLRILAAFGGEIQVEGCISGLEYEK